MLTAAAAADADATVAAACMKHRSRCLPSCCSLRLSGTTVARDPMPLQLLMNQSTVAAVAAARFAAAGTAT